MDTKRRGAAGNIMTKAEKVEKHRASLRDRMKGIIILDPRNFTDLGREINISAYVVRGFLTGSANSQPGTIKPIEDWIKREERRLELDEYISDN
jgi:hypothetical protein